MNNQSQWWGLTIKKNDTYKWKHHLVRLRVQNKTQNGNDG